MVGFLVVSVRAGWFGFCSRWSPPPGMDDNNERKKERRCGGSGGAAWLGRETYINGGFSGDGLPRRRQCQRGRVSLVVWRMRFTRGYR
ncbi:hypothetical protein HAX54_040828, partial [Datura stramonium]|nr:hypothetical protein [Datura stramonium]